MSLTSNTPRRPILCYVTDRRLLSQGAAEVTANDGREKLLNKIEATASAGVDWIQIREKDLSGKDCALLVNDALRRIAKPSAGRMIPSRLIVNDRLDVALSEHAGGAHLGEQGLPVAEARRLAPSGVGQNFLLGVSCHSLEAARSAERDGADYIFFGPVFATPSKAHYGSPQGLERLAEVCAAISIPVIAIGGVSMDNTAACLRAGAAGLAAIRLFQQAPDLAGLISTLRQSAT